ncbi:Type 1 glutamine amidotransferase-like domain-containing protein [Candidatus Woesearchaeota archaeon]|nr:Type 1 glutamine amidotransferase-like domain-containing protein [Candidatus Woesearchaeota archaeon]
MAKLILSGGGNPDDEKPLHMLLRKEMTNKRLLYIPLHWKNADFESCHEWITPIFPTLSIEMWTSLEKKTYEDLATFGGIFLGGGNTFVLLNAFQKTGFHHPLLRFINSERPVFGGSAGAIILGKDIRTAAFGEDSDENTPNITNFNGLNQVNGYALQCHYNADQDTELEEFARQTGIPILALSEKTGIFVHNGTITVKGTQPAATFTPEKKLVPVESQITKEIVL